MQLIFQSFKRVALARFRRKQERKSTVTIDGATFRSEPLTDEQRRRLLERLNRE